MRLSLENRARSEALAAAAWYEESEPGLGSRFFDAMDAAQKRIMGNPEIYRCFQRDFRKCHLKDFPYLLIFRIQRNTINVVAVMHTSRRPGYWEERD